MMIFIDKYTEGLKKQEAKSSRTKNYIEVILDHKIV